ncbi:polyketide cyclase [Methylobacterium trifolii]
MEATTIGITIVRDWRELYEAIWRPEFFPSWALGLADASLRQADGVWHADGPEGPVEIRFTAHNAFGVMDHWVGLQDGQVAYVPLRVIANGAGAEVLLTLFRQPGQSEATFARDADWVRRDLAALRSLTERPLSQDS